MYRNYFWPITIAISILLTGIASNIDAGVFRPVVILWFLSICPGMAFVKLLKIEELWIELVLAVALSITINTIVSEIMALSDVWIPKMGLIVLMGISGIGVFLQVLCNREAA